MEKETLFSKTTKICATILFAIAMVLMTIEGINKRNTIMQFDTYRIDKEAEVRIEELRVGGKAAVNRANIGGKASVNKTYTECCTYSNDYKSCVIN